MEPRWLLTALALAFGLAALWRMARNGGRDVAGRTWLLMALVLVAISLWMRGGAP